MKKTSGNFSVSEILDGLTDNLKDAWGWELSFQSGRKKNSALRVFVKTDKENNQIGFLRIRHRKFSWWINESRRRVYSKYSSKEDIIRILSQYIEKTLLYAYAHPSKKSPQKIIGISLFLSDNVLKKIKKHIFNKPNLECGGYLIGQLKWSDDGENAFGYVEDIFHDDSVGSAAHFVFTAQYGLKAYSYCLKNYANEDGVFSKNIIGNYHSHGNFGAFFSGQDKTMIFTGTASEFYLVFSPGKKEITALFKNKQQQLFSIDLIKDFDFKYCEPTIPQISIEHSRRGKV